MNALEAIGIYGKRVTRLNRNKVDDVVGVTGLTDATLHAGVGDTGSPTAILATADATLLFRPAELRWHM